MTGRLSYKRSISRPLSLGDCDPCLVQESMKHVTEIAAPRLGRTPQCARVTWVHRMRVRMEAWRVGAIKECLVERRRETEGHHVGPDRKERSPPLDWRPFSWETQRHRERRIFRGNNSHSEGALPQLPFNKRFIREYREMLL